MANQRIILYRNTNAPAVLLKFPGVDFTGYTAELVVTPAAGTGTTFTSPSNGLTVLDETVTWQQAMAYVNKLSQGVSARADLYRVLGSYREKLAAFDVQIGGIGDYFETPTYVIQVPGIAGPEGKKGEKGDTGEQGEKGDTGDITPELESLRAETEGFANSAGTSASTATTQAGNAAASAAATAADVIAADAARVLAETASAAAVSAVAETPLSMATWASLVALAPTSLKQRATVSTSDAGTHTGRTAASPGSDVGSVPNSGIYGAYALTVGAWRRDGAVSATGLASAAETITGTSTTLAVTPEGDKAALDAATEPLQKTNFALFSVSDQDGNLGVDIRSTLVVDAEGGIETEAQRQSFRSNLWLWARSDEDGQILVGVDSSGVLHANLPAADADNTLSVGLFDYSVNHVFVYGQSLAVGQALPVASPAQLYDNIMFYRGMRPQYDYSSEDPSVWYGSLVPAVEIVSPNLSWSSSLGETPCMGLGDAVKELILAENGLAYTDHDYRIMLSAPGYGATTIAQLSKGTAHFSRMVAQTTAAKTLANAGGATYAVQAVTWVQGESDYQANTSYASYLASLNQLIVDVNADLKTASGQTKDIPIIGCQIASHIFGAADDIPDIAQAQLDCEAANPLFYIATPMYHLPYSDGFHLSGMGSRWLGAYKGLAYKRIVVDGVAWRPTRPISSVRQESVVELRFHVPYGRLVWDTDGVPARTDMGFELVDSGGSPLTISSVSIIDRDRVRIVASDTIPTGAKVRYAWTGASNVGQGNLRDTQGDSIVFDPLGAARPMHNWCVIFEMGI